MLWVVLNLALEVDSLSEVSSPPVGLDPDNS